MSRPTTIEGAIAGIVLDLIRGTFWVLWMIGVGIYYLVKGSPVKKLQKLAPNESWGEAIFGVACSGCGVENEARTTHCYKCGRVIR